MSCFFLWLWCCGQGHGGGLQDLSDAVGLPINRRSATLAPAPVKPDPQCPLNDDELFYIFRFLAPEDHINVLLVSKRFRSIVTSRTYLTSYVRIYPSLKAFGQPGLLEPWLQKFSDYLWRACQERRYRLDHILSLRDGFRTLGKRPHLYQLIAKEMKAIDSNANVASRFWPFNTEPDCQQAAFDKFFFIMRYYGCFFHEAYSGFMEGQAFKTLMKKDSVFFRALMAHVPPDLLQGRGACCHQTVAKKMLFVPETYIPQIVKIAQQSHVNDIRIAAEINAQVIVKEESYFWRLMKWSYGHACAEGHNYLAASCLVVLLTCLER